jgi:hypothetical protein
MPHTNDHGGAQAASSPHDVPVQTDNVNFRGIVWFLVIIFGTVLFCQALVVGIFKYLEYDVDKADPPRAFTAATPSYPQIVDGRVVGTAPIPEPNLLTDDPENLARFRAAEDESLTTYAVIDKNAGTYRIPIDKAKDLLLAKGLPARPTPGK